jgi:hypothetical protein
MRHEGTKVTKGHEEKMRRDDLASFCIFGYPELRFTAETRRRREDIEEFGFVLHILRRLRPPLPVRRERVGVRAWSKG